MRVAIQCAGSKQPKAGRLLDSAGTPIRFVARPDLRNPEPGVRYCRPDDLADGGGTWRDAVVRYNREGSNPAGLLRAGGLYLPPAYATLVAAFGPENVYILSAGWGLIGSDYLTPDYDVTFSAQGEPWARRAKKADPSWRDFNQLAADGRSDDVHFFGGRDYLPLYYALTGGLPGRKVIHHKGPVVARPGYEYRSFSTTQSTNWHYVAAAAFVREHAGPG